MKGPERWWLLAVTLISFLLSWGKNAGINEFFFYHLPLYNKFRTPSMALVVAEVSMAALAILAVKRILEADDKRALLRPLYIAAGLTGGLCLLYALLGGGLMSFSGPADEQFKPRLADGARGRSAGHALGRCLAFVWVHRCGGCAAIHLSEEAF